MSARQIPTLRVERLNTDGAYVWVVVATSYNRAAPSGLGEFRTEDEAIAAMKALEKRLDEQRQKREPSKSKQRKFGDD